MSADAIVIIACYLIGGIPFGLLAGLLRGVDIRKYGSGNLGATNAGRVLGKKTGVVVLALDALKGLIPIMIVLHCGAQWNTAWPVFTVATLCAAAVICGHMFPVYLKFKGGKGVATSLGALGTLLPWPTLITVAVFILSLLVWRYVSLGSVLGALTMPLATAALMRGADRAPAVILTCAIAAVVAYKHRGNIERIRAGTEPKIGARKESLDELRIEKPS